MKNRSGHDTINGPCPPFGILLRQVLVADLMWELLIHILVVQKPWSAEHQAEVLIQCVCAPKDALPQLLVQVAVTIL